MRKPIKPFDAELVVVIMSLLGPDDFDLSEKERRKKLARDLSPAVRKQVEKLLEKEDDSDTIKKLRSLVGEKKAKRLLKAKKGEQQE
ncbi:hypothetical protein EU537_03740 [Candidatus Thorarchaeota archaeon]|nr:MAG: hypothetical protein EU537_03740 [Candidatus Thorarchaeota archaeon]